MLACIGLMIILISACFDSMVIVGIGAAVGAILAAPTVIKEARR